MKPLILVALLVAAGIGLYRFERRAAQPEDPHAMLQREADRLNGKMPMRFGKVLTATHADVEGNTFRVTYRIDDSVQFRRVDLAGARTKLASLFCGNEDLRRLKTHNVNVQVRFLWNDTGVAQSQDVDGPESCA